MFHSTRACVHRIGVYLVAEGAVGGFFLLHPAEEDVRDSSVGLLATNLAKAAIGEPRGERDRFRAREQEERKSNWNGQAQRPGNSGVDHSA